MSLNVHNNVRFRLKMADLKKFADRGPLYHYFEKLELIKKDRNDKSVHFYIKDIGRDILMICEDIMHMTMIIL
jgi:hypothetical protein